MPFSLDSVTVVRSVKMPVAHTRGLRVQIGLPQLGLPTLRPPNENARSKPKPFHSASGSLDEIRRARLCERGLVCRECTTPNLARPRRGRRSGAEAGYPMTDPARPRGENP